MEGGVKMEYQSIVNIAKMRAIVALHNDRYQDLPDIINKSAQSVVSKMKGRVPFTIEELHRFATHYNVKVSDLLLEE